MHGERLRRGSCALPFSRRRSYSSSRQPLRKSRHKSRDPLATRFSDSVAFSAEETVVFTSHLRNAHSDAFLSQLTIRPRQARCTIHYNHPLATDGVTFLALWSLLLGESHQRCVLARHFCKVQRPPFSPELRPRNRYLLSCQQVYTDSDGRRHYSRLSPRAKQLVHFPGAASSYSCLPRTLQLNACACFSPRSSRGYGS